MKTIKILLVLLAALLPSLSGCTRSQKISGEIFTIDFKKGPLKQPGTAIHFLSAQQRERFEGLLMEWRKEQYQDEKELWDSAYKEYTELFDTHKKEDGKVHDKDVIERLKLLEETIASAKTMIEQKRYDHKISLNDAPIKEFLVSTHRVAADADGKFQVILSPGTEYWVVAETEIYPTRCWYFRYVPDGTNLILSDGNAM